GVWRRRRSGDPRGKSLFYERSCYLWTARRRAWRISRKSAAVLLEEAVEGEARALARFLGAQDHLAAVEDEDDGEEFEGHLLGIGGGGELARFDRELHRLGELAVEQALAVDDGVAHRAGLVIVFAAGGVDGAA